jgi:hypothetical protein
MQAANSRSTPDHARCASKVIVSLSFVRPLAAGEAGERLRRLPDRGPHHAAQRVSGSAGHDRGWSR